MHTIIIGSPNELRVKLFQETLLEQHHPLAEVVSYHELMRGEKHLAQFVRQGSIVRIESPGKDFAANRLLLELGANQDDEAGNYERLSNSKVLELTEDKGRIIVPRQWYLGLRVFLRLVQEQLAECPAHHLMNHPDDILVMFDKCLCHARLEENHISVPLSLGSVQSFDELEAGMRQSDIQRVFVKLAHGSSASGVVAYQTNGSRHQATAAIDMVYEENSLKLYNSRRVKTYHDYSEIVKLIDSLAGHRVHVEQWIPKASMDGKAFDLRVLVVDGKAAHTVARLSKSPMTNLHLLNERRPREAVMEHLGEANFNAVMSLSERAMQCFPKSMYAGIDVLVASGMKQHFVLEMNAFGDLLNDSYFDGLSLYALEIRRMARYEHA